MDQVTPNSSILINLFAKLCPPTMGAGELEEFLRVEARVWVCSSGQRESSDQGKKQSSTEVSRCISSLGLQGSGLDLGAGLACRRDGAADLEQKNNFGNRTGRAGGIGRGWAGRRKSPACKDSSVTRRRAHRAGQGGGDPGDPVRRRDLGRAH